jgi:hypothetical protein
MDDPQPLFLVGNKRSGTSLLVRLLNRHPDILVTHESDVIWLLYQLRNGWASTVRRYPWDGPLGLHATLGVCRNLLRERAAQSTAPEIPTLFRQIQEQVMCQGSRLCRNLLRERAAQSTAPEIPTLFRQIQEQVMCQGSRLRTVPNERALLWLGDKKPVQQCDPEIRPFLQQHFANARYLHMIRHPINVVASMMVAARTWSRGVPPYWHGTVDEIMQRWAIHEEWVLDSKCVDRVPVHTVRLEDLVRAPAQTTRALFEFLGMALPPSVIADLTSEVTELPSGKPKRIRLNIPARAQRIMDRYGYSADVF